MDGFGIGRGGDVVRGAYAAGVSLLDCAVVHAGSGSDCGGDGVAENRGVFSIVRWIAGGGDGGVARGGGYSDADVLSLHGVLGDWAAFGVVVVFWKSSQ